MLASSASRLLFWSVASVNFIDCSLLSRANVFSSVPWPCNCTRHSGVYCSSCTISPGTDRICTRNWLSRFSLKFADTRGRSASVTSAVREMGFRLTTGRQVPLTSTLRSVR
uniref:Putative secreted protein n=1 Tax=Anopheles marajoara TaxID=58244 RepID=A0A2M4C7X1_9DIPT